MQKTFTLRFAVASAFLAMASLIILFALVLQHYFNHQLALDAADREFVSVAQLVSRDLQSLERNAGKMAYTLARHPWSPAQLHSPQQMRYLLQVSEVFALSDSFFSLRVGFADNQYVQMINLNADPALREAFAAAPEDRWLLIQNVITEQGAEKHMRYYNQGFQLRHTQRDSSHVNLASLAWFTQAKLGQVARTKPYVLAFTGLSGVSFSQKTSDGAVVGVDFVLNTLSNTLQRKLFLKQSQAFVFTEKGRVVIGGQKKARSKVSSDNKIEMNAREAAFVAQNKRIVVGSELYFPPFEFSSAGVPGGLSIDLFELLVSKTPLQIQYVNGLTFEQQMNSFRLGELDLMLSMRIDQARQAYGIFSEPMLNAPIVVATSQQNPLDINSVDDLANMTLALQRDYVVSDFLMARFADLKYLRVGSTLDGLQALDAGLVDGVLETRAVMNYLSRFYFIDNIKLSAPLGEFGDQAQTALRYFARKDMPELLSILAKARTLVSAQEWKAVQDKWLNYVTAPAASNGELAYLPHEALLQIANQPARQQQIETVTIDGESHWVYVQPIGHSAEKGQGEFLALTVPVSSATAHYVKQIWLASFVSLLVLLLFLPLIFYCASYLVKPIRKLITQHTLIEQRRFSEVQPVRSRVKEIDQLAGSMQFMAKSIDQYNQARRTFLDAFIQVLAEAIDDKSPYTAGHCERVPHLACMLAEAACADQSTFADFNFINDEQWREFKVAAWLHDCGKITTPEHIVDKGSKLECIYNRIHEIRMRFEVLWRDTQIDFWEGVSKSPEDRIALEKIRDARLAQIKEDFAFVAKANQGAEQMPAEDLIRLNQLSQLTWQRNLDDRLGLSPAEVNHLAGTESRTPALEPLLGNKTEHIYPRRSVKERDAKYGFSMPAPENLQNLGELYNLSVRRGTLTTEDRYIINEHIMQTIQMLETLPLPDDLKRVPEYAGNHHETINGKGYPRGLNGGELSIPARIMAIADIFEALTAADRPYKEAKPLSESLAILKCMSDEQHIDKDLFALFVTSGTYLRYAHTFLQPEQIDQVDVVALLAD